MRARTLVTYGLAFAAGAVLGLAYEFLADWSAAYDVMDGEL